LADTNPPEPSSYNFVMRTWRPYDPTIERRASTYDESVLSRDITHPDGVRRPTIFILGENARDRLIKLGWQDVTEQWKKAPPTAPVPAPATPQTAPPERRRVALKA
jgi:hypothetical protein